MPVNLPQPPETFRAYLAGYVDAEAHIRVDRAAGTPSTPRTWYMQACVKFEQARPAVIERLSSFYGGNQRILPDGLTVWSLHRFPVIACFLNDILPFLGEKHQQAFMILDRFSSQLNWHKAKNLIRDMKAAKKVCVQVGELPTPPAKPQCLLCTRPVATRGYCVNHYAQARYRNQLAKLDKIERAFSYSKPPTPLELCYIAGYFDGDGHISICKTGRTWDLRVAFCQTRIEGIKKIYEIYGGSVQYQKPKKTEHRPVVRFGLTRRQTVIKLLQDIQPYLIEKSEDVKLMLETYRPDLTDDEAYDVLDKLDLLRGPHKKGKKRAPRKTPQLSASSKGRHS